MRRKSTIKFPRYAFVTSTRRTSDRWSQARNFASKYQSISRAIFAREFASAGQPSTAPEIVFRSSRCLMAKFISAEIVFAEKGIITSRIAVARLIMMMMIVEPFETNTPCRE